MDKLFRKARKQVGLPAFERNCRLSYWVTSRGLKRTAKAWRVPGTPESGQWSMLNNEANRITERLRREAGVL